MGRATSLRLARDGRKVAVLDIAGDAAAAVAAEITADGGQAIGVTADVADRAQVEAAVARTRAELGPVTILINNAAVEDFTPVAEIQDDQWDRLMAVNLKAMFFTIQTVLPDMIEAGWGRVVNLSAFGAQLGAPNMALYTASKGGVISMTRSLAVELGHKGITVNSVSPGFIDTPMVANAPSTFRQASVEANPLGILGAPEDVAHLVVYLISDESRYVSGAEISVDGGQVNQSGVKFLSDAVRGAAPAVPAPEA